MKCVYDDLLSALNHTSNASYALVIVNYSVVVDDLNCSFWASTLAFAASDTAVAASLSNKFIVFFRGGTRDKVSCVLRDHVDQMLWANALSCTVAAAVAFLGVDYDLAINELHSVLLTSLDTIADTTAAALTFTALEACCD